MPALIVTKGPELGEFHPLAAGTNVIGRSPGLAVHLHDMTVSRRHLQIVCDIEAGSYRVEDLGSTHGVRVNGRYLATLNFTGSAVLAMEAGGEENARLRRDRFVRWAGSEKTTLAIVFTDVVSSTEMTSELGNEAMDRKRRAHFARVRDLVRETEGYEIKSSGDGFMLAFHAAVRAVDFALNLCHDPGERTLVVRAGVHIGPVVVEDEDVQGAAVSFAARVADKARGGGVWVSSEVKNHLDQEKAARHAGLEFDLRTGVELKGFPGTQALWVVSGRTDLV